MKFLWISAALAAVAVPVLAQTPAAIPAPTSSAAAATVPAKDAQDATPAVPFAKGGPSVSDTVVLQEQYSRARDALANGFYTLATELLQSLLARPNLDPTLRDAINLDLATACLAQGNTADAQAALKQVNNIQSSAYALRDAMLRARNQDWDGTRVRLGLINPDDLKDDRPWYFALQAVLAEQSGNYTAASDAWRSARDASTTPMQQSRFDLASMRAGLLFSTTASRDAANLLAQQIDNNAKLKTPDNLDSVLSSVLTYAVMLNRLGDSAKALEVLKDWVEKPGYSAQDKLRVKQDALRLAYALIDNENPQRPNAQQDQRYLQDVLIDRVTPDSQQSLVESQKEALALLENISFGSSPPSTGDPIPPPAVDKANVLAFVRQLADSQPNHPLIRQLRLLQAQLAIGLKDQDDLAIAAAKAVLPSLPTDPDRDSTDDDARRVLAYVYWRNQDYRNAAEQLSRLPANLPDHKSLTVAIGDLYFLHGDFDLAGNAYQSLIGDPSPPIPAGMLLMRAVQSKLNAYAADEKLNAGMLDDAFKLLVNSQSHNASLDDPDNTFLWESWFNVLDTLQGAGEDQTAYNQIKILLNPDHGFNLLSVGLRVRLQWLAAKLAISIPDPQAADRLDALQAALQSLPADPLPDLDSATRRKLAASLLQLRMKYAADNQQPDEEKKHFDDLLKNYPDTDEAVSAMFARAAELSGQHQFADAQDLMAKVIKNNPDSPHVPDAYYDDALFAFDRGTEDQYKEALTLLNTKLIPNYPDAPVIPRAKLLEADLLGKLGNYSQAISVYKDVLSTRGTNSLDRDTIARAAMGEADAMVAQVNSDSSKRKDAEDELETIMNQRDLPVEARVEAGYKLGGLIENDPDRDAETNRQKAAEIYFTVADAFLFHPAPGDNLLASGADTTWIAACLFELAKIYEYQHKIDEAANIYQKIVDYLPTSKALAQQKLEDLKGVAPPVKTPADVMPPLPLPPAPMVISSPPPSAPPAASSTPSATDTASAFSTTTVSAPVATAATPASASATASATATSSSP